MAECERAESQQPVNLSTLFHKSPDMHYVKHKLVKNASLSPRQARRYLSTTQLKENQEASSKPSTGGVRPQLKAGVVGGVCRIEPINYREIV
jgi:hypothetical protein